MVQVWINLPTAHRQIGKLRHDLLGHAILPAISDDKPVAADHSILINAAGEIRSIHSVPNLHLTGRLARVADNGKHGWRLTPASVRKAGGNRKKVEELLAELGKLQRGELPATLIEDIKKWGLYYGSATIDTLTLIEFSDRETLNDLLKHPKLKSLLTPFKAGDRSLVTVESKQVKQVRQILDSLGVEAKSAA